ncbi:alkaline phosphatase family protein [Microbispora sp. NPDC049125]|uniref:alkaline phosphatase family protein n=1 Tax=Microbispora sp. NPDC049125 TaxID=3154929 RepID=UPI003465D659
MLKRRIRVPLVCAMSLAIAGCQAGTGATGEAGAGVPTGPATASRAPAASPAGTAAIWRPAHVVIVVMENKSYSSVVGDPAAPYITLLARRGANFTASFAETHPSQPNYLALFSGSTQGVTDDSCPQSFPAAANLASQLLDAGLTFAGYSEALPRAGFMGCTAKNGRYARKHVPWTDFGTVPASANQPFTAFPRDFAALPTVSFVIPDMCGDMHDCTISTGDDWLRDHLDAYATWATAGDSLLIVTFDEDDYRGDNRIPTVLVGGRVRPGTYRQRIDHYTILRTIEEMYGLAPLGNAAKRHPLTGVWR